MAQWLSELAVGRWFVTDGEPFEIVGIDADSEVVLVQHYDGTLEDFEFDTWMALAARPCAAPEDVSGAFDYDHDDDPQDERSSSSAGRWRDPLDFLDLRDRT